MQVGMVKGPGCGCPECATYCTACDELMTSDSDQCVDCDWLDALEEAAERNEPYTPSAMDFDAYGDR